jgi:hypothetical protein
MDSPPRNTGAPELGPGGSPLARVELWERLTGARATSVHALAYVAGECATRFSSPDPRKNPRMPDDTYCFDLM